MQLNDMVFDRFHAVLAKAGEHVSKMRLGVLPKASQVSHNATYSWAQEAAYLRCRLQDTDTFRKVGACM